MIISTNLIGGRKVNEPIMIISTNLSGGREVNELWTSNIYSCKLGMNSRTRYAETVQ